jgi:hypothetical protein
MIHAIGINRLSDAGYLIDVIRLITIAFTSNLIGIVFSRSLHYQCYSWYTYQVPLLAWRTRYPTVLKCVY